MKLGLHSHYARHARAQATAGWVGIFSLGAILANLIQYHQPFRAMAHPYLYAFLATEAILFIFVWSLLTLVDSRRPEPESGEYP